MDDMALVKLLEQEAASWDLRICPGARHPDAVNRNVHAKRRADLLRSAAATITAWNTRAASGGDSESGCVTFNVIKEVADTLISLGISVPEGNEEKAARANDLIRQLCQSIRSYLAATCQSQEPSGLVWDAFEALEDTPFGEHASAKHFIRPYLQGGDVLGWRMVDGIRVFGIVPASGLLPRQEFVRYDDHLATLAKRSASGGDVAIKGERSFTATLEEPASLEQRAHDLFWALMQAPYADTTIGNIVCAETTPQRLESAWIPLLTAALANQQGVEKDAERYRWLRDNCFINQNDDRDFPHAVIMVQWFDGEHVCRMHPGHHPGVGIPGLDSAIDAAMSTQPAGDVGSQS